MIRPVSQATISGLLQLQSALRRWASGTAGGITDLVFPPQCTVCCCELSQQTDRLMLCTPCRQKLTAGSGPRCERCGAKTAQPADQQTGHCARCRGDKLWFERVFVVGEYEGELRTAVLRMKRPSDEALALAVGELAFGCYGPQLAGWKPDVLTAVPMHWTRRLNRGVNSPELVGGALAKRLGAPWCDRLLVRRRPTRPQGPLTAPQRFANLRRAFRGSRGYDWEGCRVLLVDDILTTGATSREAARVLIQGGAAAVAVAVVARATNPDA